MTLEKVNHAKEKRVGPWCMYHTIGDVYRYLVYGFDFGDM